MNGPANATRIMIRPGIAGIKDTLKLMKAIVKEYRRNPAIVSLATSLINHLPQKNWLGEIAEMFHFVRDNIRYTLDTNEVEVLRTPTFLLQNPQGDCDDMATLLATLLEATGHPARFVAVGFSPGILEHVLVEAKIGDDEWIALDTTEPQEMGWYPPNVQTRYVMTI